MADLLREKSEQQSGRAPADSSLWSQLFSGCGRQEVRLERPLEL